MRQIKFRAKRLSDNKWVYGYFNGMDQTEELGEVVCIKDSDEMYNFCSKETLGEFTSLYDKNGKGIYAGDIVKFLDSEYMVIFEVGTFGLGSYIQIDYDKIEKEVEETTDNDYSGVHCDNFISLWTIYWNFNCDDDVITQIEVIGNIYENKELIKR